ncbi:MAG: hypothetical protein OEY56_13675, partial [Cyclobacteriaceae bacterium]|nr:hypothetical protein [Cyclobacteriaceae bacterium]
MVKNEIVNSLYQQFDTVSICGLANMKSKSIGQILERSAGFETNSILELCIAIDNLNIITDDDFYYLQEWPSGGFVYVKPINTDEYIFVCSNSKVSGMINLYLKGIFVDEAPMVPDVIS